MKNDITEIINCLSSIIESYPLKSKKDDIIYKGKEGHGFEMLIDTTLRSLKQAGYIFAYDWVSEREKATFPDFTITVNSNTYGIEAKFSSSGSWTIPGGTIYDKSNFNGLKDIYLIFGSVIENKLVVKHPKYWEAISKITVTHSPRYSLDVRNLDNQTKMFKNWDEYNVFRLSSDVEKTKFFSIWSRKHLAQNKWYTVLPTPFESLDKDSREQLIAEAFALFPFDLFNNSNGAQYERIAQHWINVYFVVNKSTRDAFTSSAPVKRLEAFGSKNVSYPTSLANCKLLKNNIKSFLDQVEQENDSFYYARIEKYWNGNLNKKYTLWDNYRNILDKIGKNKNSEVYAKCTNLATGIPIYGDSLSTFLFNN